jgi:gliding motility-associated-like protein
LIPDTVAISIIATPNQPVISSNAPLCFGDTLEAQAPLNGALTYNWSFDGGALIQNDSISVPDLTPGSYPIQLYSNLGNCISTMAYDTIQVFATPQITYTGDLTTCDVLNFNTSYQTDSLDPMHIILWYNQTGTCGVGTSITNVSANNPAYSTETYWVKLTTDNGCTDSDTFSLTFNPYPALDLSVAPQCDGVSAQFANQLNWVTNAPPNTNCVYTLQFGDGQTGTNPNTNHTYPGPGNYQAILLATSAAGCASSDTVNFTIQAVPILVPSMVASCGQVGTFEVGLTLGNYTFDQLTWNIPGVGNFAFPSFEHTFINPGNYLATVNIEGSNGCDYSENLPFTIIPSVTIEDLSVPNVITPNEDLLNDQLILDNLFVDCTSFDLIILNRWGNIVYEMTNTSAPFSGKDLNGKDLEAGVYFYKLTTDDNKVVSGHITVVR